MNYMVVECHPGYVVVLDEEGRFLKVANRQYEVGQMLTDVVPMQVPAKRKMGRWIAGLAAVAACFALVLGMFLPGVQQPYASVYVKINPEVRIDVDKRDVVVGIEGVNQDGIDLVQGYNFQRKHLDLVTDELVDKAIDMGHLTADGQITISLDSQDQVWVEHHSQSISDHLQTHLQERFVVTIQVQLHHGQHHGNDVPVSATEAIPTESRTEPHWDEDDWDDEHDDEYDDDDRDDRHDKKHGHDHDD